MNSNLEYVRTLCGETADAGQLLSDEELQALLGAHVLHVVTPQLASRLAASRVDYREVDRTGLLRLTLKRLATLPGHYYAGVGNWLDEGCRVLVNGEEYAPQSGDVVDTYTGRVVFATPPEPEAVVAVETYLVDLRAVLIAVLTLMRASRARLALRANLSGLSVDLTAVCQRLQAEIDELPLGMPASIATREDYPH